MVKHQYYLTTNEKHIFKNTRFGGAEPIINMGSSYFISITITIFSVIITIGSLGDFDKVTI